MISFRFIDIVAVKTPKHTVFDFQTKKIEANLGKSNAFTKHLVDKYSQPDAVITTKNLPSGKLT